MQDDALHHQFNMPDDINPSTTMELADADPNGDVLFIMGHSGTVYFRVSPHVLTLASPVFAAMFSHKFSEGIALSMSAKPYLIPLPEDDPEAMGPVCHALHLHRATPHHIAFALLEKVVVVVDKIDLGAVLSPWSVLWLQDGKAVTHERAKSPEKHRLKMLRISTTFNNHRAYIFCFPILY